MYGSRPTLPASLQAREAVQHDGVVRRAEADHLHDAGDGAHVEDVLEAGLVDVGVALADDADDRAVLAEQVLDEAHAARRGRR